jgi:hypothetical protein
MTNYLSKIMKHVLSKRNSDKISYNLRMCGGPSPLKLQNRVLRANGNLDGCSPVLEIHVALKIPHVYDYD